MPTLDLRKHAFSRAGKDRSMNTQVPAGQEATFLIVAIIFGGIAGAVCGLLPFFLGRSRGRRGLGIGGLVACILSGFVLGLLAAVPMAILFTIIIVAMGHAPGSGQGFPMEGQQQYQYGAMPPPQYPPPPGGMPQQQVPPPPPGQQRY
jgi:hypothetical protein